jgi:aspartate/methionine/tyrosine aminotransferase
MIPETFHVERFFAEHEFSTPHLLAVSDCESTTVGELLELEPGARRALDDVWLGYTPSEGGAPVREAVAATVPGLEPEQVLIHAAGVEVIFTLAHAVLGPGDHAVVQAPCYQALRSAPRIAGAEVEPWWGRAADGAWRWDIGELEAAIRPETRLVVINTPHNPTGHQFGLGELERVVALCEARDVQLFVDEAYRGTERRPEDRLPSVTELSETAAALGLVSKAYGLPGLRLGWLATRNTGLRERVSRVKDFTTICAPAPGEFLVALALRHAEVLLGRNRRRLGRNLELLRAFMTRHADRFAWEEPRAGSVCFPVLREGSADALCRAAREEAGVLLAPGGLFDAREEAIRVGYGRASFPEALGVLDRWLEARR